MRRPRTASRRSPIEASAFARISFPIPIGSRPEAEDATRAAAWLTERDPLFRSLRDRKAPID
jgi:hypothetical protein